MLARYISTRRAPALSETSRRSQGDPPSSRARAGSEPSATLERGISRLGANPAVDSNGNAHREEGEASSQAPLRPALGWLHRRQLGRRVPAGGHATARRGGRSPPRRRFRRCSRRQPPVAPDGATGRRFCRSIRARPTHGPGQRPACRGNGRRGNPDRQWRHAAVDPHHHRSGQFRWSGGLLLVVSGDGSHPRRTRRP